MDNIKDCVFCKIAQGKAPAYKIWEDENFVSFLDIYPHVEGHTLLIPKSHSRWIWEMKEAGMMRAAGIISKALIRAFEADFVSYLTVGIDVPHTHLHLLPRMFGKGISEVYGKPRSVSKDTLENQCKKIKSYLH